MMWKAVLLVCLYCLAVESVSLSSKLEALAKMKASGDKKAGELLKEIDQLRRSVDKNDSSAQSHKRFFGGYDNNWNMNDWFNNDNYWPSYQGMNNYYGYMPRFMYYLQDVVMMQNIFMEFHTNRYILQNQFGNENNMYDMEENMRDMFRMSQNMYQTGREHNWWEQYDQYRGYYGFNNNGGNWNSWNSEHQQEGYDGFNNFGKK